LQPRQNTGRGCSVVLPAVFYVMVFAANTPDSYRDALLYFLQMKSIVIRKVLAKNKQVQPQHRSKNPRHKKLTGSCINIM